MRPLETTGAEPERRQTAAKVIAVVGAESAAGLGLVRAILDDPECEFAARAIVRRLDSSESRRLGIMGAELLVADPQDAAALGPALAGAYGAFYIQLSSEHPSLETKLATANALACAAKAAGLQHLVWATLEDPGQTFLEQNDVTPTFQNGRWISDGETESSPGQVFTELEIPTTFLHTAWEASVAAGKWAEDIGTRAYGLLRDRGSIGQTVSISATRLIRRLTPPPLSRPKTQSTVQDDSGTSIATSSSAAVSQSPSVVANSRSSANSSANSSASSSRKKRAIAGMLVVAAALMGFVILRQLQRQKTEAVRARAVTAPAPRPPPVSPIAVKPPEVPAPAPPAPVAPPPEAPPAPELEPPAELAATPHGNRAPARHVSPAPRSHRRELPTPSTVPPPVATAPSAQTAPEKVKTPPRVGPPVESHAPAAPATTVVSAPAPPAATSLPQPGFVDPKGVNFVVRSHAAEANACYERAIMETPDLHGRLTIHAVIDPTGHVLSLAPTSRIEGGARLQSCLVGAFKSWTFPQPVGGVNGNVTYSFAFESLHGE